MATNNSKDPRRISARGALGLLAFTVLPALLTQRSGALTEFLIRLHIANPSVKWTVFGIRFDCSCSATAVALTFAAMIAASVYKTETTSKTPSCPYLRFFSGTGWCVLAALISSRLLHYRTVADPLGRRRDRTRYTALRDDGSDPCPGAHNTGGGRLKVAHPRKDCRCHAVHEEQFARMQSRSPRRARRLPLRRRIQPRHRKAHTASQSA